MARITPGTCWTRNNWNVVDEERLHQPQAAFRGPGANPAITATNAGDTLFLRVERETFRRLPSTQALVFGIRVHVEPIRRLASQPERLRTLWAAIQRLPPEVAAYKGVPAFGAALDRWCQQVLA
jgi:hypothetical protein